MKQMPEFIVDWMKDMSRDVVCTICTGISVEPRKCQNCNAVFCKEDLDKWRQEGTKSCPNCREEGLKFVELTRIESNLINNLRVIGCPITDCLEREN